MLTNLASVDDFARFRAHAELVPHIVWTATPEGSLDFVNGRWWQYTGLVPGGSVDEGWRSVIPLGDMEQIHARLSGARRKGEPFTLEHRLFHQSSQRYRWVVARALPHRDHRGAIVKWVGTLTDVDEFKRAERQQTFLADASRIFAESLDVTRTLQSLAELMIPEYADWCQIDMLCNDGRIQTQATAHLDPIANVIVQRNIGGYSVAPNGSIGAASVIRTGRSELFSTVDERTIERLFPNEGDRRAYAELGIRSEIVTPLIAAGGRSAR